MVSGEKLGEKLVKACPGIGFDLSSTDRTVILCPHRELTATEAERFRATIREHVEGWVGILVHSVPREAHKAPAETADEQLERLRSVRRRINDAIAGMPGAVGFDLLVHTIIGAIQPELTELERALKVVEAARKAVGNHYDVEYGCPGESDEAMALDDAVKEFDRG